MGLDRRKHKQTERQQRYPIMVPFLPLGHGILKTDRRKKTEKF